LRWAFLNFQVHTQVGLYIWHPYHLAKLSYGQLSVANVLRIVAFIKSMSSNSSSHILSRRNFAYKIINRTARLPVRQVAGLGKQPLGLVNHQPLVVYLGSPHRMQQPTLVSGLSALPRQLLRRLLDLVDLVRPQISRLVPEVVSAGLGNNSHKINNKLSLSSLQHSALSARPTINNNKAPREQRVGYLVEVARLGSSRANQHSVLSARFSYYENVCSALIVCLLTGTPSTTATGVFGQPSQSQQPGATGLFGQQPQNNTGGAFSAFGSSKFNSPRDAPDSWIAAGSANNQAKPSIFGQPAQQPAQPTTGFNVFGQQQNQPNPQQPGQQPTGGLFGGGNTTGGLFGQNAQQQQQSNQPAAGGCKYRGLTRYSTL
jgi:hypothetical protein